MTRPLARSNPGVLFQTARASVGAIRPAAPTEHPYAPPKKYTCIGCGTGVELELLDPLPDGWVVVDGEGGRAAYRCAGCAPKAAKKGRRV